MNKHRKRLLFIIGFFLVVIMLIIYRYEKLLIRMSSEVSFNHVPGGMPRAKTMNTREIIALIHSSKEYLGDSITIFDNGEMQSSNGKFQGTIHAVIKSTDNMDMVKSSMAGNKLPIQYNIYVLAATFYRTQYADEFKPAK